MRAVILYMSMSLDGFIAPESLEDLMGPQVLGAGGPTGARTVWSVNWKRVTDY